MSRNQSRQSQPVKSSEPLDPALGGWLLAARVALGIAAAVSVYLIYTSVTGSGVAGCGPEDGCSEVLNSRWSKWLGLPVSLPALGMYLGLLWGSTRGNLFSLPGWTGTGLRAAPWMVIGAAVWFLGLSAFVLHKFCPYCFTVHLAGTAGAVFLLRWGSGQRAPAGGAGVGNPLVSGMPWAALGLAVLAGGQLLYQPATYRVGSITPSTITPTNGPAAATDSVVLPAKAEPKPLPPRILSLYGGRFQLDLRDLPLLGSPDAPHAMVAQFDYTCEHCRRSHGPILEAQRQLAKELAVVCLPMPIDAHCNEWIRKTPAAHTNACQFAALGLAVWRADRTKFREFDDWVMSEPEAQRVPVALSRARELVGEDRLAAAFGDPWVANTLQLSIALYRSNAVSIRSGAMPMLLAGTNVVTGTVKSSTELLGLIDRSLGIRPASSNPAGGLESKP